MEVTYICNNLKNTELGLEKCSQSITECNIFFRNKNGEPHHRSLLFSSWRCVQSIRFVCCGGGSNYEFVLFLCHETKMLKYFIGLCFFFKLI